MKGECPMNSHQQSVKGRKSGGSTDSSQFFINIRDYQHNSWQGSVQRLDTGETLNFRSSLELLHLIEAVAGQQDTLDNNTQRIRRWKSEKEVDQTILQNGRSS